MFEVDLQLFGGGGSKSGLGGGRGSGKEGKGNGQITGYLFYYTVRRGKDQIRWFNGTKKEASEKAKEYGDQIGAAPEVMRGFESRDEARKWWNEGKRKKGK